MTIAKIENGIVTQADHSKTEAPAGWVVAPESVVVGQIDNGDGTFSNPLPSVSRVADDKIAELKTACRDAIFAGFGSGALGTAHRYPLSQTDQANLQKNETAAARNLSTTGWECYCQCIDANGVQDYRPHTAPQMIQAADDIQDGKEALLYGTLRPKIGQVRTIEADDTLTDDEKRTQINAITW